MIVRLVLTRPLFYPNTGQKMSESQISPHRTAELAQEGWVDDLASMVIT